MGMPVVRTDGRAVGRSVYGHVITKFSRMGSLPHFFTHGAPLRALRARDLRYNSPYGEGPPEMGTFGLQGQGYERVGISLVEVYERVGRSVISVGKKRVQKG